VDEPHLVSRCSRQEGTDNGGMSHCVLFLWQYSCLYRRLQPHPQTLCWQRKVCGTLLLSVQGTSANDSTCLLVPSQSKFFYSPLTILGSEILPGTINLTIVISLMSDRPVRNRWLLHQLLLRGLVPHRLLMRPLSTQPLAISISDCSLSKHRKQ
jgi:hypothetical protein